ncbi:MAG: response regulator transcription factor [Chloroflexi bacterium]|nr:response regulator transcription factor [Chloroflexota bacterium]
MTSTAHALVLAVDDDPSILKLLRSELMSQGLQVITATNGEETLRLADEQHPDLIVLDVMLPDISGLEVMRRLRERSTTPIILLTGKGTDGDNIRGLLQSADDYLTKPFNPEELSARAYAILRRARHTDDPGAANRVTVDDLEIDLDRRVVRRAGKMIALTRTEWNLLQQLASNAGKLLASAEILSKVWGPEYRDDLQYLRVWVSRLRSKLETDDAHPLIKTFRGVGYMFDGAATSEPPSPPAAPPRASAPPHPGSTLRRTPER